MATVGVKGLFFFVNLLVLQGYLHHFHRNINTSQRILPELSWTVVSRWLHSLSVDIHTVVETNLMIMIDIFPIIVVLATPPVFETR